MDFSGCARVQGEHAGRFDAGKDWYGRIMGGGVVTVTGQVTHFGQTLVVLKYYWDGKYLQ